MEEDAVVLVACVLCGKEAVLRGESGLRFLRQRSAPRCGLTPGCPGFVVPRYGRPDDPTRPRPYSREERRQHRRKREGEEPAGAR